ncbi:MAG: hypothetical protein E7072_10420 [Bacteroidales bacterium]|nr:hypothetical protein [Bacteroidales bacterium]MBO5133269.1 hypothetical protein [Paludibacteraceae bacterium]
MSYKRITGIIIMFFAMVTTSYSQAITVSAALDSSIMKIGEQRKIALEVKQPHSAVVYFPTINGNDTLAQGIEILKITPPDTLKSNNALTIKQEYFITSFDTGRYVLPPFVFKSKTQSYTTEQLYLDVITYDEDLTNAQLTGMAENYDPPFNWVRFLLYLSIVLGILGLGALIYYIYKVVQEMKNNQIEEEIVVDNRLPHEIALEELEKIKSDKLWQKGEVKVYYTVLTDTLRDYFTRRFNIPAMEMTSSEIIRSLKYEHDAVDAIERVREIFDISDMVKFAKMEPSQEDNEISIVNAFFIVNKTKKEEVALPEVEQPEETGNTKIEKQKQ